MCRPNLLHVYQAHQRIIFSLLFPALIIGVIIVAAMTASGNLDLSCSEELSNVRVRIGDSNAGTPLFVQQSVDGCLATWKTEDLLVTRDGELSGTFIMEGPSLEGRVAGDFFFGTIEAHYAAPFFGESTSILISGLISSVADSSSTDGAIFHIEGTFQKPSSRDSKINTLDCIDLNFTWVRVYEPYPSEDYEYQVFAATSTPYVERAPLTRFDRTSGPISARFMCYTKSPESRLGEIANARWPTLMPYCRNGISCTYLQWIKENIEL